MCRIKKDVVLSVVNEQLEKAVTPSQLRRDSQVVREKTVPPTATGSVVTLPRSGIVRCDGGTTDTVPHSTVVDRGSQTNQVAPVASATP
jgi:hypothetical protein